MDSIQRAVNSFLNRCCSKLNSGFPIINPQRGKVLTRQMILEKLWDANGNYVDEHALTVNIGRLRRKVEQDGNKYIKTIYGMGYMWEVRDA